MAKAIVSYPARGQAPEIYAMRLKMKGTMLYRIFSSVIALFLIMYLAAGQWFINNEMFKDQESYGFTRYFIGETTLLVSNNLNILLTKKVHKLEFHFTEGLVDFLALNKNIYANPTLNSNLIVFDFKTESFERRKKSLTKKLNDIESKYDEINNSVNKEEKQVSKQRGLIERKLELHQQVLNDIDGIYNHIHISLIRSKSIIRNALLIDKVYVNDSPLSLHEFMESYIDVEKSNVYYHSLGQFSNMSRELALKFGVKLLLAIQFLLITAFSFQAVLFLIGFCWSPPHLMKMLDESYNSLLWLDRFSSQHAIPAGFMGTVLSLWIATETNAAGFKDFEGIFSIFKIALFTTALALVINLLCILRSYRFSISRIWDQKSES